MFRRQHTPVIGIIVIVPLLLAAATYLAVRPGRSLAQTPAPTGTPGPTGTAIVVSTQPTPLPRPAPVGSPDPVVHFSGTPVDHHIILPALPAPPPRTPVPWTVHDAPGQARPSAGYQTPTAGQ